MGAAAVAALGAVPFFAATTFTGDDHLFLAFARHVQNPLAAFASDMHGGEFYRPLPMLLWWLLGRAAGGRTWPFAAFAFLLHLLVSLGVGLIVAATRRDRRAALIAGCFFFLAPATREAAYWYSASTDLLAVAFGLGALLACLSRRWLSANLLLAAACLSKESAAIVPLLAVLVCRTREPGTSWRSAFQAGTRLLPAVAVVLACRTIVLGGVGGSGDVAAPFSRKLLQVALGLTHSLAAGDIVGQPLATAIGLAAWVALLAALVLWARRPSGGWMAFVPFAWILVTIVPLLGAPWVVGARYFYFAFVGIAWLSAQLLARGPHLASVAVLAGLGGLSLAQASARRAEVTSYEARLAVARRAVLAGLSQGHQTFHVASGIKDIDLAVKEGAGLQNQDGLVVLGDVPASFVSLPAGEASRVDFLLARPSLPPAGAYRFGQRRIVGLARRGDDPTMDEVIAKLPDLRFIRLRLAVGGRIIYRDVTDTLKAGEDESGAL
jgi:hypothetical protein